MDELKDLNLGAVAYSDGSANNVLKIWGWGSHGYIYDLDDDKGITKNKVSGLTVSDIGYLEPGELKIRKHKVVNPIKYLDWYGAYSAPGTNNIGEMLAIIETVEELIKLKVKKIVIYSDSQYSINSFDLAKTKTVDAINRDINANVTLVLRAKEIQTMLEEKNIDFSLNKIKAHSGHLGNVIADDMAMLGRIESSRKANYINTDLRDPKGYWKPKNERHPFLIAKQIFFTNNEPNRDDGSMDYSLLGYKEEMEIGKKMHVATYRYVSLKERDENIELVKNVYKNLLGEHSVVSTIRMDLMFKADIFKYIDRYGTKALMPMSKNRRGISVLEKEIIANSINPPALAYIALDNIGLLKMILRDFNRLKEDPNHKTAKEFIEITDYYYTFNDKNNLVIKPELTNDVKSLKYNYVKDGKKADIIIQFGKDIIGRNQIKKIEKMKPRIYLCVMNNRNIKLDYFTVIDLESTGDQMVCSNYYTKTVFLK